MPRTVPQTLNRTCSRYVGSGHELCITAAPAARSPAGATRPTALREPGPAHKRVALSV